MISARVADGFGASSGCVAYTSDLAGPVPNVIQRSHGFVGVVHGAATVFVPLDVNAEAARTATAERTEMRMRCYYSEKTRETSSVNAADAPSGSHTNSLRATTSLLSRWTDVMVCLSPSTIQYSLTPASIYRLRFWI